MGDKRPKERDCPLSNCTTTVNKPSQIENLLIQPISAPFLGLSDKLFLKDTASHIARRRPIIETSSGELQSCALQRRSAVRTHWPTAKHFSNLSILAIDRRRQRSCQYAKQMLCQSPQHVCADRRLAAAAGKAFALRETMGRSARTRCTLALIFCVV